MIRLWNRFFASYLLGVERERSGRLFPGDVTNHAVILARLCVLFDEFPDFYWAVTNNQNLLRAADKLALGNTSFTTAEAAALEECELRSINTPEPQDEGRPDSARATDWQKFVGGRALQQYLMSTARSIAYPDDLLPLLRFEQAGEERLLGSARHRSLVTALDAGDAAQLVEIIGEQPDDLVAASAETIINRLRSANAYDAPNYVAASAGVLKFLAPEAAKSVANEASDLLQSTSTHGLDDAILAELLDHCFLGHHPALCRELVDLDNLDDEVANLRMNAAAAYMSRQPTTTEYLSEPIETWLSRLDEKGGWELGIPWLPMARELSKTHPELAGRHLLPALIALIRSSQGVTPEHVEQIMELAERSDLEPTVAKGVERWPQADAELIALGTRLALSVGYEGSGPMALIASAAAANPDVGQNTREQAVTYLASTGPSWGGTTVDGPATDDDEDPVDVPVGQLVAERLAECAELSTADAVVVSDSLALLLPRFEDGEALALIDGLVQWVVSARDVGDDLTATQTIVARLCEHFDKVPADVADPAIDLLLSPLQSENDPQDPAVQQALNMVSILGEHDVGISALHRIVDSASAVISQAQVSDSRTSSLALVAVGRVDREITDPHSTQLLQRFSSQAGSIPQGAATSLFAIAHVPWSAQSLPGALGLLEPYAESLDEDTARAMFGQLSRLASSETPPAGLLNRLVNDVVAQPTGPAAVHVSEVWSRLTAPQQRRIAFTASHQSVTNILEKLDSSAVEEIVTNAPDAGSAAVVLDTREGDGGQEAATVLANLSDDIELPADVATELASRVPTTRQRALSKQLLELLPRQESVTRSALAAITAFDQSQIDTSDVDRVAAGVMRDSSPEVATQLGQLLAGKKLSRETNDLLKVMRRSDSPLTAEAFDAAQKGRP